MVKSQNLEKKILKMIYKERRKEVKGIKNLACLQIFIKCLSMGLNGLVVFIPLVIYVSSG